jgi:hypothetical protein
MKPSFSPQYSLYRQVQDAKEASASVASSVLGEIESPSPERDRPKSSKTFSPTKTIGVMGGGLIALTGLYILGQKVRDFLFGEASQPSPPSVPPTPLVSEVVEEAPVQKENPVARATKSIKKSLNTGWKNLDEKTGEVKENALVLYRSATHHLENFLQHGLKDFQNGMNIATEGTSSAIVCVTTAVKIPYNWERSKAQQFRDFIKNLWRNTGLDVFGNTNPHAESSVYHPTVEVMPPVAPLKPKTALEQGINTIDVESKEIPKEVGEVVKPQPVRRITNRIQEGFEEERRFFDRLAEFWKKIGYNPLTGQWENSLEASAKEAMHPMEKILRGFMETFVKNKKHKWPFGFKIFKP